MAEEARKLVYSSPIPRAALRPLKQPLWDTENVASTPTATNQIIFFQRPIGQPLAAAPAAAKTLVDTNLNQAAQLGTPREFDVWGFNVRIGCTVTLADYQTIVNQGLFQFFFGQGRPWLQVQLADVPTGSGASGAVSFDGAAVATPHDLPVTGISSTKEMYPFTVKKNPVRIRSNETFSAQISWPNAAIAPVLFNRITVIIRGIMYSSL